MRPSSVRPKYDGITRAGIASLDEREAIYYRDGCRCRACGEPLSFDRFEVAHRIANTVYNRKRYGDEVIDHPLNKAATHTGRCNDAMNCGNNPGKCAEILRQIEVCAMKIFSEEDD